MNEFLQVLLGLGPTAPPPPPPRQPAGAVTPVLRTELDDVTAPDRLGAMVTSSEMTEADIDRTVQSALMAQAEQDELIEDGGRLIGLRIVESRPVRPPGAGQ